MGVTDIDSLKEELPERYEVLSVLGQGGIGVVFKVRDLVLDKLVAVKTLRSRLSGQQIVRFHSEARVLGRLNHPNILTALDFQLTESGTPFLVIDYLEGEDLETYVKSRGPLTFHEALPLFLEIVDGLAYAHSRGVIHRDMKPSNVMLVSEDGNYTAKILDFGLSKLSETEEEQKLTSTGAVIGSPLYMSPEQAKGKRAGKASDVYSLGALFYKVLSGRPPVQGETYLETVKLKLESEIPDLEGPDLPEGLNTIVQRCLALEPEERYQDLAELKADLSSLSSFEGEQEENDEEDREFDSASSQGTEATSPFLKLFLLVGVLAVLGLVLWMVREILKPVDDVPEVIIPAEKLKTESEEKIRISKEAYEETRFIEKRSNTGELKVVSSGALEDKDLKNLEKYDSIVSLSLSDTNVTGKGLEYLTELPNLRSLTHLYLSNSQIKDKDLAHLEKFPRLHLLEINQCPQLSEKGLIHLSKCKKLKALHVQMMKLGPSGCRNLAKIPQLHFLDMRHVRGLSADALKEFRQQNHIKSLFFGGNLRAKGTFIDASTLKALTFINSLTDIMLENVEPDVLRDGLVDFSKFKYLTGLSIVHSKSLPENTGRSLSGVRSLDVLTLNDIRGKQKIDLNGLSGLNQVRTLCLYNLGLELDDRPLLALGSLNSLERLYLDDSYSHGLSLPVRKRLSHLRVEFNTLR